MARREGPREWRPHAAQMREIFRYLDERTVDTGKGEVDENRLRCVADPQADGTLLGWHVTDNPEVVEGILRKGRDLQKMRPWGDLCGGLYVSACPDFWRGRSRKKWDFIETLTPKQARALADLIVWDLWEKFERGYITGWEHERGRRDVEHYWLTRGNWHAIVNVSGQPWNVPIQILAREGGIADPFEPAFVEVVFTGRYLDAADRVLDDIDPLAAEHFGISEAMIDREDVCRYLREKGWDGAFTKSSMGTNAELVIWNGEKIRRFGDWVREVPSMGASLSGRGRIPTYSIPEEIERLVQEGLFQEFTQAGDPIRSFGRISKSGFEVRLWVDREQYPRRRRTGFRYGVTVTEPNGKLSYESSGNDLGKAVGEFRERLEGGRGFGPREWRPGTFIPRAELYHD